MAYPVVDNPDNRAFEIQVDGVRAGAAEYTRDGMTITVTHVEVDPAYAGRGLGSALARGVLESAREQGGSVLPACPFLRDYLLRHPEYQPLVPASARGRFGLTGDLPSPA